MKLVLEITLPDDADTDFVIDSIHHTLTVDMHDFSDVEKGPEFEGVVVAPFDMEEALHWGECPSLSAGQAHYGLPHCIFCLSGQ